MRDVGGSKKGCECNMKTIFTNGCFDVLHRGHFELLKYCYSLGRVDENTPYNLIKKIKPDIIVKGGDYNPTEVVGVDLAEVVIFNYIDGYSTSNTLAGIKK